MNLNERKGKSVTNPQRLLTSIILLAQSLTGLVGLICCHALQQDLLYTSVVFNLFGNAVTSNEVLSIGLSYFLVLLVIDVIVAAFQLIRSTEETSERGSTDLGQYILPISISLLIRLTNLLDTQHLYIQENVGLNALLPLMAGCTVILGIFASRRQPN